MKIEILNECPDCLPTMDRRLFVKRAALGAAALAAPPLGQAAKKKADTETLVAQLFGSLNENQKKVVAFPFEHPLREKVDNNWHITKKSIGEIFTEEQQALAARFGIRSIPTLLIMRNGKEIARVAGAMPAAQFNQWVSQQIA